jgi:hypothetical protein
LVDHLVYHADVRKSAAARPLIRLPAGSYTALKSMSKESGRAMSDLAADAIERFARDRFWDDVNRAYAAMTPSQRREYRRETAPWDGTLADGLKDEDWEEERRAGASAKTAPRGRVVDRRRSRPRA